MNPNERVYRLLKTNKGHDRLKIKFYLSNQATYDPYIESISLVVCSVHNVSFVLASLFEMFYV